MRRPVAAGIGEARLMVLKRFLPVAWLLVLLVAPGLLWLLGSEQPELENRPRAELPDLNRGTVRNPATFERLDDALRERLALRELALEVKGRLTVDLLGDSPNPNVAVGDDGWLFWKPELGPCRDRPPRSDPRDAAEAVARTYLQAGRRIGVVLPTSKLLLADDLAPDVADLDCLRAFEDGLDERLSATPGAISLRPEMERLEARGTRTFRQRDTHWTGAGQLVFVREVLDAVRPGLADEAGLALAEPRPRRGDLARFTGLRDEDPHRPVQATRTPAEPPTPGSVAIVGDSQFEQAMLERPRRGAPSILERVLPGQADCTWTDLAAGACDAALRSATATVLQIVSRDVDVFTLECWRPLVIGAETLTGRASRFERLDGGAAGTDGGITFDARGTARVRVVPRSGDRAPAMRLLRLPVASLPTPDAVVRLRQDPRSGPRAPCATPSQSVAGAALWVPIPAGRDAADLVLQLSAPPGTRLGPPEEIALDAG